MLLYYRYSLRVIISLLGSSKGYRESFSNADILFENKGKNFKWTGHEI